MVEFVCMFCGQHYVCSVYVIHFHMFCRQTDACWNVCSVYRTAPYNNKIVRHMHEKYVYAQMYIVYNGYNRI